MKPAPPLGAPPIPSAVRCVEHTTPLRGVVPRLASHLVRADREAAIVHTPPGQIELPAKNGDGEFDDRQHETMQPVPIQDSGSSPYPAPKPSEAARTGVGRRATWNIT